MKLVVKLIAVVFLFSACIAGIVNLYQQHNFRTLDSVNDLKLLKTFSEEKRGELKDKLNVLEGLKFSSARIHVSVADIFFKLSLLEKSPEKQEELFCKGFEALTKAVKQDRENPTYATTLATQMLFASDKLKCIKPDKKVRAVELLEKALQLAPLDPEVLFSAAQIYWELKARDKALTYLKRYLEIRIHPQRERIAWVKSLIRGGVRLQSILPETLPRISFWSRFIIKENLTVNPVLAEDLSLLQQKAIEALKSLVEREELRHEQALENAFSLFGLTAEERARKLLDQLLSRIFELQKKERYANYFKARAQAKELNIIKASLPKDKRPEKGVLSNWSSYYSFYIDRHFNSVGFFNPAGQRVSLIELLLNKNQTLDPEKLKLMQSGDNYNWQKFDKEISLASYTISDRQLISLAIPFVGYRYLKLHYQGPNRDGHVRVGVPDSLRAFADLEGFVTDD